MLNIITGFLLSVLLCSPLSSQTTSDAQLQTDDVWITVFIHGTIGLRYTVGPYTIVRLLLDNVEDTEYENMVEVLRSNPIFYKNQAMQELGLHRIQKSERALGAWLFSQAYDTMQQYCNPRTNVYYTFGWSGLLSERERRKAGNALYKQLKDVYRYWSNLGYTPYITLLGYSHGGTVAEYVAPFHIQDQNPSFDTINELILMGTPIQHISDCYATWPIFKRVYNIYSRGDFFQKFDFLSTEHFWARRRFRYFQAFTASDKIYQIGLSITMPPYHNGKYQFYRKGKHRKSYDPGHIEWYFFGWPNASWMYRNKFPFAPLPTAVLIPSVLAYSDRFPSNEVVCEIWPPEEKIRIRERKSCRATMYPFIPNSVLHNMQEYINQERPYWHVQLFSDYSARMARDIVYDVWEDIYDKCG